MGELRAAAGPVPEPDPDPGEQVAEGRLQEEVGPKPTLLFALSKMTCRVAMTVSPRMVLSPWNQAMPPANPLEQPLEMM